MSIKDLYSIYLKHPVISTDTRKIQLNSLFFALKGENFDGNKYADEALENGASYAVISDESYQKDNRYILVEDTLVSLQDLARHHRNQLTIPIIGITGSNGKTTTKELMKSALQEKFNTYATFGNLNNHIGVPLSLLSITKEHEIAIIEMGANHKKEIEFLVNICNPDCGLITNIGKAHLEGFGGIEGVEKGKTELFTNLNSREKQIFINVDDSRLAKYVERMKAITYGSKDCKCIGEVTSTIPFLIMKVNYRKNEFEIGSNLIGTYNFNNILSAVVIADYYGVSAEQIKKGIENYLPTNNRSQLVIQGSNKLIMDAYNANPSSMKVAIANLVQSKSKKKFFILGDMLELGKDAKKEHEAIVELLMDHELKGVLVGKLFRSVKQNEYITFSNNEAAKKFLKTNPKKDTLFLIKGSRGIKLETIQEVL
ncbi:MAG: UDP-N-acetylmuramoyl-tripeptide--D-alanyl-D-alanine ligase [Flavobacteriales bacterium]|nr:UDP-N-acetylmuramoyl-tripeptide--D-alanyl-D-alanine ligase [Flavobacteriales bacterium]